MKSFARFLINSSSLLCSFGTSMWWPKVFSSGIEIITFFDMIGPFFASSNTVWTVAHGYAALPNPFTGGGALGYAYSWAIAHRVFSHD